MIPYEQAVFFGGELVFADSERRRISMNWDQIEGKWKQSKGKFREKWGKLTDDDLDVIAGRREQLIGLLQERYGMAREKAEKEADEFVRYLSEDSRAAGHR